jgi:DNA-binding transcriptional MerR regulator
MEDAYRSKDVCRMADVTPAHLIYMAERGILEPSIGDTEGRGSPRLYSREDILVLVVLEELRNRLRIGRRTMKEMEPAIRSKIDSEIIAIGMGGVEIKIATRKLWETVRMR